MQKQEGRINNQILEVKGLTLKKNPVFFKGRGWLHTGYILSDFSLQFTILYEFASYKVFNTVFIEHNFYQFTSVTNTKCWIIHERF